MKQHFGIIVLAFVLMASVGIVSAAPPVPSCDFTANTESGQEDLSVTFTATYEGIAPPVSYEWDFGDGSGADKISGASVTHTYRDPGKYTVSLIVNDLGIPTTWWVRNTKTDFITVTHIPPVANFTYSPKHGNAPLDVSFVSNTVGQDYTLAWDFGDGNTGEGVSPTHTFAEKGVYTVILNATNDGGSNEKSAVVTVTPPAPVANFEATSTTTGAKPFAVQFADTSAYDGPIITWTWDFGDGSGSAEQNPLHVYTAAGNYDVYLMVDTLSGNSEKFRTNYIHVLDSPEVCPEIPPTPAIPQDNVGIFRKATGYWYFDTNGDHLYEIANRFGNRFDTPVIGDMNGDGMDDYGIFRPSNGYWYFDYNLDGAIDKTIPEFGTGSDILFVKDFNADGNDDVAVFRPSTGYWYIDTNLDGFEDQYFRYGGAGDVPVAGAWI